jgi:DNA-binding XRE family transcriptional regulator
MDMTQERLAEELGVLGQTVNAIENAMYNARLNLVPRLAEFFETSVEEIFRRGENC